MAKYEYRSDDMKGELTVATLLAPYAAEVDAALKRLMESGTKLGEVASDAVTKGGKRIRPSIALLACEAVSGSFERALPVAIAYELAHSASLTQDDIIDESSTRRGAPTVHNKYGVSNAILVSDVLLFKIFEVLGTYGKVPLSKKRLAELLTHIGAAARKAAEGEFLEVALAAKSKPSESDYVNAAGLKTGSLFAGAAASGAIVGNATSRVVNDLYEYGYNLGVSFQVVDDILDITGESKEMGKPLMKDLQNDATNIIIIHALQNADPYKRNAINSMMWKKSYGVADVLSLRTIFEELGSIAYAVDLSARHASLARERLRGLAKSSARLKLEQLAQLLEARRS